MYLGLLLVLGAQRRRGRPISPAMRQLSARDVQSKPRSNEMLLGLGKPRQNANDERTALRNNV